MATAITADINNSKMCLPNLPNEILMKILQNLSNTDVLYSLTGIGVERLDLLVQSEMFTNKLNFVSNDSHTISSINTSILDRFCLDILPQIQHNVRHLIVEVGNMERILFAGEYPNLIKLKIFNLNEEILSRYLTDESTIGHIFKKQITDLTIRTSEKCKRDIYTQIISFFEKLTDFHVDYSFDIECPILSIRDQPSTTFFSPILTKLSILVHYLEDCLCLLDGRLKKLSSFTVSVFTCENASLPMPNVDNLCNLRCFSLTYQHCMGEYGTHLLPLLRRMNELKRFSLNVSVGTGERLIDGNDIHQDILIYMPRLQSFVFHIQSTCDARILGENFSSKDIEQTFINIGYEQVVCVTHYCTRINMMCHVFSVPYAFDLLHMFGKNFGKMIFTNVTRLALLEYAPLEYEFFFQLAQSFPFIRTLRIHNSESDRTPLKDDIQSDSFAEYPYLTRLDVSSAHTIYIEQLLHYSTTHLPRLTELEIDYEDLKIVTNDFTRDATRMNCCKIKVLECFETIEHSDEFVRYFPSL